MKKFRTIEDLKAHYSKPSANGSLCEVLISALVKLKTLAKVKYFNGLKPQSKSDIDSRKAKVLIESKTGSGWLTAESYTKEEADTIREEFLSGARIYGKQFVGYTPKFTVYDNEEDLLNDCIVLPAKDFTAMLIKFNLIRTKKSSNGLYGVAIQQWQTTPKWGTKATKERELEILDYLWEYPTLAEFLDNLNI